MIWRILPHATVCIASGRLILLDIRCDRYFRVPSQLASSMRTWLEGASNPAPLEVGRMLVDNGIARDGDPGLTNATRETVRIPSNLISPFWNTADVRAERRSVIAAQLMTRLKLRTRSLQAILHEQVHGESTHPAIDPTYLWNRCTVFARSRASSPFPRNCLLDSLSLKHWLGEAARDCRIVFGVTAHPFTAHCWLQSATFILNDSYDHVSRHTPILVV